MFVVIRIWVGHETTSVLGGFSSSDWGPFDEPQDALKACQEALGAMWRPATASELAEYLGTVPQPSSDPWEQLSLL